MLRAEAGRLRAAWAGRVSGCLLGKSLELPSFEQGPQGVTDYLRAAGALPLRDYVPLRAGTRVADTASDCCLGHIVRAEPDDDIDCTLLALILQEEHSTGLETADVARAWLRLLPAGWTWTAEREAYGILLSWMAGQFVNGEAPGFDLNDCSGNAFNDWIGARIRTDLYGWACPGRPALAADLARRDAGPSHRGEGVHAAVFVAALAAAIPACADLDDAFDTALGQVTADSLVAAAVRLARSLAGAADGPARLHRHYENLSPLHAVNNLALVVWALVSCGDDFSVAIGETVSAGGIRTPMVRRSADSAASPACRSRNTGRDRGAAELRPASAAGRNCSSRTSSAARWPWRRDSNERP